MKRTLFFAAFALLELTSGLAQDCHYGTVTDNSGIGENAATGNGNEYSNAADFNVPFGTTFTANQVTVNVLKGPADLNYVNIVISQEEAGFPGTPVATFSNLTPTSQTLVYQVEGPDFGTYAITVDLPEDVVLEKGKYFVEMQANPGGPGGAWWEITAETQTYGSFDFIHFGDEPWGGAGYYSKVFQIAGTCADSGETYPDYGDACSLGNTNDFHQGGTFFLSASGIVTVADDFVVPENTIFYLTHFNMGSLLLGGGFHNATIKIFASENGQPGQLLHTFEEKGPDYEQFNGYFPFPGSPLDVVSVTLDFSFEFEPIALTAGTYFISVTPTPNWAEILTWELTTNTGIGGNSSYSSGDGGQTWTINEGINQIFTVSGFCGESLGTGTPVEQLVGFYPNPVENVLNLSSQQGIVNIGIYDVEGRLVRNFDNPAQSIDLSALSNGIYVAKVQLENGSRTNLKLVKK